MSGNMRLWIATSCRAHWWALIKGHLVAGIKPVIAVRLHRKYQTNGKIYQAIRGSSYDDMCTTILPCVVTSSRSADSKDSKSVLGSWWHEVRERLDTIKGEEQKQKGNWLQLRKSPAIHTFSSSVAELDLGMVSREMSGCPGEVSHMMGKRRLGGKLRVKLIDAKGALRIQKSPLLTDDTNVPSTCISWSCFPTCAPAQLHLASSFREAVLPTVSAYNLRLFILLAGLNFCSNHIICHRLQ